MKTIILIITLAFSLKGFTQHHKDHEKKFKQSREKIEAAKIGFITNKLDLTSKQAQKFWPIHNEYSKKKLELKKTMMKDRINQIGKEKTEKDWEQKLEAMSKLRKQEFELEEEYKTKFLKVLSAKQVVILFKSEKDFMNMLRNKISEKHRQGKGIQNPK